MTDKGEQRITRFHVSPHILLHTWDETWGLLQQVSGDGAKICYKNPVLLKVAFGHLFYLQKNTVPPVIAFHVRDMELLFQTLIT